LDDDQDGGWVSVSSGTGSPGESQTERHKVIVGRNSTDFSAVFTVRFQNKQHTYDGINFTHVF